MNRFLKSHFALASAVVLLLAAAMFLWLRDDGSPVPAAPAPPAPAPSSPAGAAGLSALARAPVWADLEIYQNTIQREEFEYRLANFFTTGEAWKDLIEIQPNEARIVTGDPPPRDIFVLRFAQAGENPSLPRFWRPAGELPPTTHALPLAGIHIAIDPGHIGGEWSKMEERWFMIGAGQPVQEGDMTLAVAKLLRPRLESLGAKISLVREENQPVTSARPESLMPTGAAATSESPRKLAERLFYRTAEIHARAAHVNQSLQPDLVLCLHFNAESWGDPNNPTLIPRTHLHLLVNGGYNDAEVILADQRFALVEKLLQRTQEEEILVGATVAQTFSEITGLPAYRYAPDSKNVRAIPGQPFLWARNLLANRLYQCPVIFMEPYVMNSTLDYARIQAGAYAGLREFDGKLRPNIFEEYADALTEGLKRHYLLTRVISD